MDIFAQAIDGFRENRLAAIAGAASRYLRNYVTNRLRAVRDLAANLVRRCGLDELDELEGLGLAVGVAAVDLA